MKYQTFGIEHLESCNGWSSNCDQVVVVGSFIHSSHRLHAMRMAQRIIIIKMILLEIRSLFSSFPLKQMNLRLDEIRLFGKGSKV